MKWAQISCVFIGAQTRSDILRNCPPMHDLFIFSRTYMHITIPQKCYFLAQAKKPPYRAALHQKCYYNSRKLILSNLSLIVLYPPPALSPPSHRMRVLHRFANSCSFRNPQAKSTGGAFAGCVAAGDGLLVKMQAPSPLDTPNVLSYYSGSKNAYGLNVQATCDANYRFCSMSAIAAGSTNNWTAWNRSGLSDTVARLPPGFYMLGDAAYPLSDQLLTPYPGKLLPRDQGAFNF